ncbi:MAG TPA: hypothetical protein VEU47_01505 [Candidatus Cybelea sp.]|nr:hypothetical protein [Candidatus Cybelea sp.]
MSYGQSIEYCFAGAARHGGISQAEFAPFLAKAGEALARLRTVADKEPLWKLPGRRDDLSELGPIVESWRRFDAVVVLGIGGSSLGGQALAALAPNTKPRVQFLDSLQPDDLPHVFAANDAARTGYLLVSKSGSTAETISQALVALGEVSAKLGAARIREHVVAIAEPGDNALRRLSARHGIRVLDHDPDVGGRFSVLSVVGMLPALLMGLDPSVIRSGAADVLDQTLHAASPSDSPPALGAAVAVALQRRRDIGTAVMLSYASVLERFIAWHRQLWAESLGKQGEGTTPVPALGPVDQHSQLQLYLGGPPDKFFTVFLPKVAGTGPRIDVRLAGNDPSLGYLDGRTIGDLVDAEGRATIETLARNGRPTRVMQIDRIDQWTLGALFMHFLLETVIAAHLLGVDPYGQPAVEEGKVLARKFLAEMGQGAKA